MMEILSRQVKLFRVIPLVNSRQYRTPSSNYDYDDSLSNDARTSDLPVISTPQKMIRKLEKLKERKQRERKSKPLPKGPLVISCERKDYNFRRHEKFNKHTDFFKLVSCGWKNRKRIGDQFTLIPYADNPSLQHKEDAVMFDDLGLSEAVCQRLNYLGYQTPTQIQRLAIPPLLRGDNVICAAETGSGKTLSYLAPAVERIVHQKTTLMRQTGQREIRDDRNAMANPHTLVVTPNRELTEQVMSVALSLTSSMDVTTQCLVGGKATKKELRQRVSHPIDILITTPGILNKMLASQYLRKSNLQSIIIDESDTLLDDSFLPDIHNIFHKFQVSLSDGPVESNNPFLSGIQLSLVSATMPKDLDNAVGHIIPIDSMTKVTSRGLHQLMPHVPQTFHRINPDNKPEKLILLLKKNAEKGVVSLVFAKNSKTCFYLRNLLRENEMECLAMNGELTAQEREGVFSQFKEGYSDILVATDIASRGLDTTNVHHVINYDFPDFLSDYVHRVGRVGRVGSKHTGCVTSFVSHKWEVEMLWKIETAARMGQQLENVNANIKRKLEGSNSDTDIFSMEAMS